jgi:16S rRNA (adenine1518-N6/adenine1519-N6)-dimethyltransferase
MPAQQSHTKTRQKLGQHFLSDISWRTRIAETLPAHCDSTWIEIGAGHGEMTELLATHARRVIAIETDAALIAPLRERAAHLPAAAGWSIEVSGPNAPKVEIVHADILSLDLPALAGVRFRVYGNLPYYITSPILTHLFRFADQIDSIHIVTQLEVAQRIAAHPRSRDYGYLSTLCQFYARPELVFRIPPDAFQPRPKVTSALIEMRLPGEHATLGIRDEPAFLNFLHLCFAHKRKTLRNNLRGTYAHDAVAKVLAASPFTDNSRAEELTLHQFAQLFISLAEK